MTVAWIGWLVGCGPQAEPVPDDLEGLFHFLWAERSTASDEDLHAALVNLDALVDGASLSEPLLGRSESLDDVEQAQSFWVGDDVPDPAGAAGMTLVDPIQCDRETIARFMTQADQQAFFDGFDAFEREFLEDWESWVAQETERVSWDEAQTVSMPIDVTYDAEFRGGARWVPPLDDEGSSPLGRFFLVWHNLVQPAVFTSGEGEFTQEVKIALVYAPGDDRVVHVQGLWREIHAGLVDSETEAILDLTLDAILDIDQAMGDVCGA